MKSYALSAISALLLVGCGDQKSSSPSAGTATNANNGGSVLTAPVDYLRAAGKAQQSAVKTVDTASLNQAIQLFNVEKGRNPKDLNELVQEKFIPQIPATPYGTKLVYDAASGKVTVVKE
jgi:hypothetical protein